MDFNTFIEVIISIAIVACMGCIIKIYAATLKMKSRLDFNHFILKEKLVAAKQENSTLVNKIVLCNEINSKLIQSFFDIINKLLSLQKFIFEKGQ
ncbi:hypothetical protein [Seonamhaeicola aphaedonensis]|uniref:Uncharacterized protein n=1 Tax=Seonamhaeicola aphaedonensis TaxID=1461338 RepID=A0A3D9HEJ6_9FLAO|nr:hypothetical protein [Seonamhaeicola aphaedonensis]RED47904.1 hypothetical protein DFQ02_105131 [Seonamhaeicola aphaedonensis]